jgi:hypothetical protein
MNSTISFLLGLLLRLGIPLGISAVLFFFLRKLDSHWQKQAVAAKINPPRIPCWEIKGCSEEKRVNCKAASQKEIPCWQVFRDKTGLMQEKCLDCNVFQLAPIPAD